MPASVGAMSSFRRSSVLSLVLGLTCATGCRPAPAVAPVQPLATGSNWVAPSPDEPDEPEAQEPAPSAGAAPLMLLASDVGGEHDELVTDARVRAEYDAGDPWLGAEQPLVTIVAYLDYQCPYSRRLLPTLYELASLHAEEVRVVFKHFPLPMHTDARFAAMAATAAQRQGRFWAMHDSLFENSRALGRESVMGQAGRLGLDLELFRRMLDDPQLGEDLDAQVARAKAIGIKATPTMVINGRSISGARPLADLQEEFQAERALAQRLLDAGASRSALYAHLMHAARAEPVAASTQSSAVADDVRREIDTTGLPRKGAKDPRVVIVECSDFDCPFCKRVGPTLEELLANHPDDVALFYRHLPLAFHKGAEPAARAAVAAQAQGKFWKMHDLLFANPDARSDAELEKLARKAGLNVKKFRKAMRSEATAARVKAETEACQADGARGTPNFFINGRKVSGARPLADFERVVAEELERRP